MFYNSILRKIVVIYIYIYIEIKYFIPIDISCLGVRVLGNDLMSPCYAESQPYIHRGPHLQKP